ncbi:hypothetical protein M5D96_008611 [Drosophila gunungcola]|uniref:non-specific protein-tyrosine kinase n=1 Tax=Drosophila gunungcola TaxID=103775 RepID=A0A9P9YKK5_9MUSC|nr:hypothetical protein M5D96_008611 [Drosophila gunungcola]
MEYPQIDLYEFLTESELQQYYNAVKNELKITNAAQFKYAADEDLRFIGLSRPEIRRLRKFYEKHFPHSYLSKIKRLLQAPGTMVKREEGPGGGGSGGGQMALDGTGASSCSSLAAKNGASSPGKVPNNKHIIPADSISVNKQLGTGEFGIVQQGVWSNGSERKDHLLYRQGDIITVLDRNTGTPFWKGVLSTGKTGYFNPSNTVAFLEGLPSSNRDCFSRVSDHRISKRKLRTEMISKPQNDFKHTGHVGIDGATFGDIAFLGSSQNYNHVPKQIVTPYKPSEDIEQTPLLLPPTPTSPDSLQTASGYFPEGASRGGAMGTSMNPTFIPSAEHTPKLIATNGQSSFDFASGSTNPFFLNRGDDELEFGMQNNNYGVDGKSVHSGEASWRPSSRSIVDDPHEYHEISDDEMTADKLDFGPSLLDEINSMFGSISGASGNQPKSPGFDHVNSKNEFAEMSAKLGQKSGDTNGNKHGHGLLPTLSKKKSSGTVKPISVKDERILNHAIDMANEISARSMIDLVSDQTPAIHSPKRKFSFRFPHLSNNGGGDKAGGIGGASGSAHTPTHGNASPFSKKKNFTEELQSIPDIQRFRSLSEIKNSTDLRVPIFDKESSDFLFQKSREILSRPLNLERERAADQPPKSIDDNIMDIENTLKALNLDFMHTYTELDKSDSNDTILNDQLPQLVSLDDGISSATGSLKSAVYSYSNGVQTMFDFNAATSHLDKHLQYMHNQAQLNAAAPVDPKPMEDKRSSTPDTGFASRDTNISLSRRSSQKSSYSPQESFHFPLKSEALFSAPPVVMSGGYAGLKEAELGYERFGNGATKQMLASASPIKSGAGLNASSGSVYMGSKGYRQRSTSFNESFNPISPVLSEQPQRERGVIQRQVRLEHQPPLPRRSASYKPRSIRARTLRRLSYNPMTLDSSSSSGEEAAKPSLARSECDIRTRVAASSNSSLGRRRRAGMNRQVQSACHDEREAIISPRQIYGSNSSIKSAPHYNFGGQRRSFHRGGTSMMGAGYEQFQYDERIYDFGGRGPGNNYNMAHASYLSSCQKASYLLNGTELPGSGSGSSSAASSAVQATYRTAGGATTQRPMSGGAALHEFDISRLTGKSPTSTNFVGSSPEELKQRQLSSLIGKEGLEAYNSLIERKALLDIGPSPAATLLRHLDTDEFDLQSLHQSHQRPMTLPTRGAAQRVRKAELAAGLSRHNDENSNSLEACESPSYMTHGSYKFPEAPPPSQQQSEPPPESLPEPESPNPIPLPPREGKKQVKTSTKRHVRKYPLIIPANGLQRTLSKLTDFGEDSAGKTPECSAHTQQPTSRAIEVVAAVRPNSMRRPSRASEREYENMPASGSSESTHHTYQNLDKLAPADAAGLTDTASLQFESILEADSGKEGSLQSPDVTDGFYNFSIQKEHYNKAREAEFEVTQMAGLYVNDDELRNLDIESSRKTATPGSSCSASQQDEEPPPAEPAPELSRRFSSADSELAGNALFKKVRASVNMAMNRNSVAETTSSGSSQPGGAAAKPQTEAEYFAATAARLADSNSVSCEDLLEFSDKKPRGCERGVDSDEVRIMVKVLGKDSTPNRCLGALEFINWDVHKSIKLIKLQNLVSEANLSLEASFEALQQHEWDLHTTAHKLNGLKL